MCFRLRRVGDLMAVKERRRPQEHGGGGRREDGVLGMATGVEVALEVLYSVASEARGRGRGRGFVSPAASS